MSRRSFLRTAILACAALVAGPSAACGGPDSSTLGAIRRQGFIRVGVADEQPHGYMDSSGRITGAGPELARKIMHRLDVPELDGVQTTFGSLIPDLQAGRIDMIAAGMFITPERCQDVIFSVPYYCVGQALLVATGNPLDIHRYEDVAEGLDFSIGVMTGAVEAEQAADAGIPIERLRRFDTPEGLLEAVRNRRIDAAALNTISVETLAQTAGLKGVEVTEGFTFDSTPGCGAFAFRPQDEALRNEFNRVLTQMQRDGEVEPVIGTFGFSDAVEAADGITAQHLCGL